ncbi:DUF4349 domain-containing protein [Microcella sp.]|uniref:DUF4349 domain-containing protein n=1 Tax=Microcella sp. TaxID=1913979 RepID=UPI00391AFF26
MRTSRGLIALPAIALAALLLSGCATAVNESSDSGGMPGVGAPEAPVSEESGGDGDLGGATDADDRSVVTTGYLYLTVEQPLEAASDAVALVERIGGRVDARQEYAPRETSVSSDAGGAELVLRIPASRLTATLDDLKQLGEVEELQLSSTDVSREVQDVDARVAALRSSITRLLALQGQADTVDDLIDLESAISDRQAQLESYEAQQRALADQVSLSSITLVLGSPEVAPPDDEPATFLTGLTAGWEALVAFGTVLLVITGALLPWIAALGIVGLIVLLVIRFVIRRRAAAQSAASVASGGDDVD